ncbi:MAG: hypothetical protein QM736_03510 [Vicinamibacterales bacterium]
MPTITSACDETDSAVTLRVEGVEWRFRVSAVTRVERNLFITVGLDGPESCSLVVRLRDRIVLGLTASEVLLAACEWLLVRGNARHGYRDLAESQAHAWDQVA